MVVRMRHTRAHTANRRSHHALKMLNLVPCPKCEAVIRPHRMCDACGYYRDKAIVTVEEK